MNLEEAANRLEAILDKVDESIDDHTKLSIRQELIGFRRSLSWAPEFAELRRIAQEAFDDLGGSINRSVLNRMRARSKELAKYTETIAAVTARAEKDIDALRLEYVRTVTVAAEEVTETVRAIKASIDANNLAAAGEQTEKALDRILKLIREISERR